MAQTMRVYNNYNAIAAKISMNDDTIAYMQRLTILCL